MELALGFQRGQYAVAQQLTRLQVECAAAVDVAEEIVRKEPLHVLAHVAGHPFHHRGDAARIVLVLDGFARLVARFLRHRALLFQRQGDTPLRKYFIDRSHGIQHLGEADERGGEIHHLAQFLGGNTHIERRTGMGLQLRERLHRSEGDAGDHFALFQCQITRLEYFTKDELLEDVHHFRVRALPGKGLTAEQGAVILLANIDSVHIFLCLCRRRQAAYQCGGGYYDCFPHGYSLLSDAKLYRNKDALHNHRTAICTIFTEFALLISFTEKR